MSLFGSGRREAVFAVLLLVGLAAVQQIPWLVRATEARLPVRTSSAGPRETDSGRMVLQPAMRDLVATSTATGAVPDWNPAARFGEPIALASGAVPSSPPLWLLGLAPPGARWPAALLAFLCSAVACVTTFRLLRALSLSRYAAFLGAALYGLGWFSTANHGRPTELAAAALVPWMLESGWRCLFPLRRSRAALGMAAAVSLAIATGGVTTAALGALWAAALVLFGLLLIDTHDRPIALGTAALGLLGAGLLTAPIWLDVIELAPHLRQPNNPPGEVPLPAAMLALIAPGVFAEAGGTTAAPLGELAGGRDPLDLAWYPGGIALFVGLLGLFRPKRNLLSLFWIGVVALALFLLLPTPLAGLVAPLAEQLPMRPGAALMLFHLGVAILAAFGLEGFLDAPHSRTFAVPLASGLAGAAALLAVAAIALPTRFLDPLLPVGHDDEAHAAAVHSIRWAVAVPGLGLAAFAVLFATWQRLGILRLKDCISTLVLAECLWLALVHRESSPPGAPETELPAALAVDAGRCLVVARSPLPSSAELATRAPGGLVNRDGDRLLERTARYLELLEPSAVRAGARSRVAPFRNPALLDSPFVARAAIGAAWSTEPLQAVGFGASPGPVVDGDKPSPAAPLGETVTTSTAPGSRWTTYLATPPPRRARLAWAVHGVDDAANADRALRLGAAATLDTAVIESPPRGFQPVRPATPASLDWICDAPDELGWVVNLHDGRGYLVVSDAWAPGWQATIDGEPTPILHADMAFRALPLREGRHTVRMVYRPLGARFGPWLLGLGLLLLAVLTAQASRRK